jgi:hypothetical protein
MAMTILEQNNQYRLELERLQGKWWLTLIELATGNAQTLISSNNKAETSKFFKGLSLSEIKAKLDSWNIEQIKTYKKG